MSFMASISAPTMATGDFKISKDGAGFNNLTTLVGTLVQQNQTIHNGIVNLGTMTASGNPTSANTRVN